jgi:putative hydrolase of the HAD superfamily
MPRILRAILFDLDNTLYDASVGLQAVGDERITQWIMRTLNLSREDADALRLRTWREYGTTAKGLEAEFGLPPKPLYDEAISAIEPREYLQPSPELEAMLSRLRADCHVFTNATEVYARKVLAALGVLERFGRIFDIAHNGWECKPGRRIYESIIRDLALPASEIAFVEDNPRNLVPAAELGMVTVLLDNDEGEATADLRIATILDLADALATAGIVTCPPPR